MFVIATRAALGAGRVLVATGAVTTIPAALAVFRKA